jgi:ABC-type antimicrobial peptide transport system permease subunit
MPRSPDMPGMFVVVKAAGAPADLVPAVRSIIENLDPKIVPEIRLLKSAYEQDMVGPKRAALMVSLLGMVAALLAALGVVGLAAYSVSQRMKELAVRIALGARRMRVVAAVGAQFAWPVAAGLVAGVGIAGGLSKVMRKVLFGLENWDPLSYTAATVVLGSVVALAVLVPAWRALRMDLAKILHYE